MCFRNLPIDFDAHGRAYLREEDAREPFAVQRQAEKVQDFIAGRALRNFDIDPVTRVAGALAFHTVVDLEQRRVLESDSMATLFRGYEVILKGRDPRDAIFISSRACGVCGGVHSTCSALALEMAFGICPPPLAIIIRNLALTMEFVWDNAMHLFMLAGPDYSEAMLRRTQPSLWGRATRT